ncbi:hypothetical protein D2C78_05295 [Helicobacter pylori]|nr:hypothetical protein D2C78_05295 [Helicobacter pylori]
MLCFVILKLILKNISNSFYKGIGGYFEIILPLNPLKIPLTQEDRFFSRDYRLLTQALCYLFGVRGLKVSNFSR